MEPAKSATFLQSWELVDAVSTPKKPSSPGTKTDEVPKVKSPSLPSKPLCGYLTKQGGRGIIKPWRTRWFVFDDARCTLFYYRNPQDFVPLGHIDISIASFSFDMENVDKGQFEIKAEDRVFYLQAESRASMMHWLSQLQAKRKASSRLRRILESSQAKDEYSGLANMSEGQRTQTLEERLAERTFDGDAGVPGAAPPGKATGDWSLTSLKQEFRTVGRRLTTPQGGNGGVRDAALNARTTKATWTKHVGDSGDNVTLDGNQDQQQQPATSPSPFGDLLGDYPGPEPVPSTSPASAARVAMANAPPARPAPPVATTSSAVATGQPAGSGSPTNRNAKSPAPHEVSQPAGLGRSRLSKSKLGTLFTPGRWSTKERSDADNEAPSSSLQPAAETTICHRCPAHEQRISTLQEEVDILETEVSARQRLIQNFHQQLTATQEMLKSSEQFVASPDEQSRILLLCGKDQAIAELQSQVDQRKDESDRTEVLLLKLRREISDLTDQCKLYQETLFAKDEVVVSLSNEVYNLKHQSSVLGVPSAGGAVSAPNALSMDLLSDAPRPTASALPSIGELKLQVEQLKDTVGAYQMQNDFLNTEIIELDQLRQDDKKLIATQSSKMVEMEAAFLKLHSNHLIILQEMQKPQIGGMQFDSEASQTQEMVSRLLEDAMETTVSTGMEMVSQKSANDKYDRYGFEREDLRSVAAKATLLHRRGKELELMEGGHRARWELHMKNRIVARRFEFTSEVKNLIRQGIPSEYRTEVWRDLIYARVQGMMQAKGSGYYQSLHQMSDSKGSLVYKQIELDLLRTLPGNKYYNTPDAAGVARLRRLLRAYAWHNPVIGYCQGLNRLAAIALLVLNEEDAFWCLVLIADFLMPKTYYSTTLMASQVDQRVLKDLMAMKLPRLAAHLDNHNIDIGLITFNWFLTIFVDNVPFETVLHVWDSFLYEGCKVLFRFALGVFKLNEERLLQLEDTAAIFQQMREMAAAIPDNTCLAQASFQGLNPFPMRLINKQRALHTAIVKEELAEMEILRNSHKEATFESRRDDPAMLVFSDDDEI